MHRRNNWLLQKQRRSVKDRNKKKKVSSWLESWQRRRMQLNKPIEELKMLVSGPKTHVGELESGLKKSAYKGKRWKPQDERWKQSKSGSSSKG